MFSAKVLKCGSRGTQRAAQLFRAQVVPRSVVNQSVYIPTSNIYLQQRNFGMFSDFSKRYKEEMEKIKQEEAAKKAAAATSASGSDKNDGDAKKEDEETGSGKNKPETESSQSKAKETTEKVKEAVNEQKERLKSSVDEKTKEAREKLKANYGETVKETSEKLKEQGAKLTSFWGEFSGELKKQMNIKGDNGLDGKKRIDRAAKRAAKKAKKAKVPSKAQSTAEPKMESKTESTAEVAEEPITKKDKAEPATSDSKIESIESLESLESLENLGEEEADEMSDEALGITAEMTEEEAEEIRKEFMRKKIKVENYENKKVKLKESLKKTIERGKVKIRGLTWEKVKYFLRDGWNDLRGNKEKDHRVILDPEEEEKKRQEILKAREETEKKKEEAAKTGETIKTELMNVDNSNLWVQMADLLRDAPLIESILEMGKKVKESKVGETVSYAAEDMREKWETSQHPLVYKLSAVYDELFAESENAQAINEVRRTDPSFMEFSLRDEMKDSIVPKVMRAMVDGDTRTLKVVLNDHAYAQVYSVIKVQQSEGLHMDPHILSIGEVTLLKARCMERQTPVFVYQVPVQMVNCIRNNEGVVVQGKEDDIKQMYYLFALQQEHDDELNIMKWKIAELQMIGEMSTL